VELAELIKNEFPGGRGLSITPRPLSMSPQLPRLPMLEAFFSPGGAFRRPRDQAMGLPKANPWTFMGENHFSEQAWEHHFH